MEGGICPCGRLKFVRVDVHIVCVDTLCGPILRLCRPVLSCACGACLLWCACFLCVTLLTVVFFVLCTTVVYALGWPALLRKMKTVDFSCATILRSVLDLLPNILYIGPLVAISFYYHAGTRFCLLLTVYRSQPTSSSTVSGSGKGCYEQHCVRLIPQLTDVIIGWYLIIKSRIRNTSCCGKQTVSDDIYFIYEV